MVDTFQSDHASITQIPQLIEYCSDSGLDDDLGKYPCDDDQYYHSVELTGFEDAYNPYDPRVMCHQDIGTTCPNESYIYIFRDVDIGRTAKYRAFLPKGTDAFNIYVNLGFGVSKSAATIRFGTPTSHSLPDSYDVFENFTDHPELFDPDDYPDINAFIDRKSIAQLKEKEWYSIAAENNSYIHITGGSVFSDESGWLYFELKPYNYPTIRSLRVEWWGYKVSYQYWYNSSDFSVNGDPPEVSLPDPDPAVTASPASIAFGYVPVKTFSVEKTISITNESDASITLTPSIDDGFAFVSGLSEFSIASKATAQKNVQFYPNLEKYYTGNLTFTADGETVLTVPLSGTSLTGQIVTATPTSLIFGYVPVNTHSDEKTVAIANESDDSITLTPSISAGFSVPAGLSAFSVAANNSVNKNVRFDPTDVQAYNGSLTLSAGGETVLTVPLSGTSTDDPAPTGLYRKGNPHLVYGSTGELYLFFDFVTELRVDGSEIVNIYYAVSTDHGASWSNPAAVTGSDRLGEVNSHPYSSVNDTGDITLAYTKNVSSLLANGDTDGWCGYFDGAGKPIDLHFDASTGKLYAILARIDSGTKFLASVVVIDTINWVVEKCYSATSSPAFSDYWCQEQIVAGRNQGGGHYAVVGEQRYAMVINHDAETITQYNFEDNAVFSFEKNIDVDWRNRGYLITGTHVDADEDRLYITWYSEYAGNVDLLFGYIDLTETPDAATGKYTWNEIFYRPDDIGDYIHPGTSTIVKEADIVMITFYGVSILNSIGGLLVYSLSSGNLIKRYLSAYFPELPKWDIFHPVCYDGHIYAHFTYEANYGQEDKRGLVDIDMSNDSVRYITPSYASGVNDFALNRKIATGDGRLIISTYGYGIQIFTISTGAWVAYDNTKIPGLTPNGSNDFEDIEYDKATGNIFACSGYGGWYGVIMFNENGSYKTTKYREGSFTQGDYGTESDLTIGKMDYEMAIVNDKDGTLWGVWTRADGDELSLKWDKDLAIVDLQPYLTGKTTLSWEIESTAKLDFSVANGHLFDQFNLSSSLNPVLAKGRKVIVEFGEVIDGVQTWQSQGVFVVMEKSMTYRRGEHPVMSVRCEDIRALWNEANITATEYYSDQAPEDVLHDIVSTHANLTEDLISLPGAGGMTGSHHIDHQWIDTKIAECIQDIMDHWGYFSLVDVNGKFTIKRIDLSASPSHTYSNTDALTQFSPDDSYGSFISQVIVKGEGRYFIEVTYTEEQTGSDTGTLGWWGCEETRRYYFSDDHEKRCQNPRLVITQEPTINVLFVQQGGGEIRISLIDEDMYFIDVYISAPNLVMVLVALIAALVALVTINLFTHWIDQGIVLFFCMLLVISIFYVLSAVAQYAFEIYAFPIGKEKQTFQAQADDFDLQRELGFVSKTEIDDPFCYDVATCQAVADRELAVVQAQRKRITFDKIGHLQDEVGDVIQIVHPYSGQAMNVFITSISRSYTKPDGGGGDGGLIDSIDGWIVS